MFNFIFDLNPVIQALIASLITWLITSIGSAIVFCFKKIFYFKATILITFYSIFVFFQLTHNK